MAEKAVQTAKNLIKKAVHDEKDLYLALLEYRNTPLNDKLGSPAQRFMGRRTKTLLPTTDRLLRPKVIKTEVVQQELTQQKERQKYYYDKHATPLTKLNVGDHVTMQIDGKWRPATVTSVYKKAPRSYFITTPEGQTYRRNRRHIKKVRAKQMEWEDQSYLGDDDYVNAEQTFDQATNTEDVTTSTVTPVPLHRSERQVKEPIRYADSWS